MTSGTNIQAPPQQPAAPLRFKYRIRFGKSGDLRFVSHHGLMHICERLFRRADLEVATTQGFNPRPRIWFASALGLGVVGCNEILEFELTQAVALEMLQGRLCVQAPPGLVIASVRAIDVKTSARVRRAFYRLPFPETDGVPLAQAARSRRHDLLEKTEHWIERTRPHCRRVNVRPFVNEIHIQDDGVVIALWITDNGAARPEEVFSALGLQELLDAGGVIERTDLEVYDELPAGASGPPAIRAALIEPISKDFGESQNRPTAIFDSPMSFDS
jgi:radical SAM-linked protein